MLLQHQRKWMLEELRLTRFNGSLCYSLSLLWLILSLLFIVKKKNVVAPEEGLCWLILKENIVVVPEEGLCGLILLLLLFIVKKIKLYILEEVFAVVDIVVYCQKKKKCS
ncbi:hypothetical protein P3S68_009999 [Capsicum galapagoense]